MMMIKIGIVDDQTIIRQGLKSITESAEIQVVGEAWCVNSTFELVKINNPDILLLDSHLPDIDIFVLKDLLIQQFSNLKIIALIGQMNIERVCRLVQANFHGIMTKESSFSYMHAIKAVHEGHYYCQPDLAHRVIGFHRKDLLVRLSNREYQVLDGYLRRERTYDIAHRLRINPKTVLNIKLRCLHKLQTSLDRLREIWLDK